MFSSLIVFFLYFSHAFCACTHSEAVNFVDGSCQKCQKKQNPRSALKVQTPPATASLVPDIGSHCKSMNTRLVYRTVCLFTTQAMNGTHCAFLQKDDPAELTWANSDALLLFCSTRFNNKAAAASSA